MDSITYRQLEQQRAEIHQLQLKQMEQFVEQLRIHYLTEAQKENSRAILDIMRTCYSVLECLQSISWRCISGEDPQIDSVEVAGYFERLRHQKKSLENELNRFVTRTISSPIHANQMNFLKSVKAMLTDEKMRSVCLNLPKHISRGSAQDIKRYGSIAVILSQDIEQMMTGFQKDLFLSH